MWLWFRVRFRFSLRFWLSFCMNLETKHEYWWPHSEPCERVPTKGMFFLNYYCAFRTLIGWAGKLQSHARLKPAQLFTSIAERYVSVAQFCWFSGVCWLWRSLSYHNRWLLYWECGVCAARPVVAEVESTRNQSLAGTTRLRMEVSITNELFVCCIPLPFVKKKA